MPRQKILNKFEMKSTNLILMRVLKIHFTDRLHILDEALVVLKNYSNKTASTQSEYNKITATLREMFHDLPEDIMKYFLTLVPLPKNKENLALNNHNADDIRGILLDYIKRVRSQIATETKPVEIPTKGEKRAHSDTATSAPPVAVKKKLKKRGPPRLVKTPQECKKLLDICAEYVVKNHANLYQTYHAGNKQVWKILENANKYKTEDLDKLYEVGGYLNQKLKWLRLLESEEITDEIIRDSYYDEDIFVGESDMAPMISEDPFVITETLQKSILDFINK